MTKTEQPLRGKLLALGLILAGVLLASVMVRQLSESLAPYTWQKLLCSIERSEVLFDPDSAESCKHLLEYRYETAGAQRTGATWHLDQGQRYEWCSGWASFASRFPPGTTVDCYIDPEDPNRAVLDRGNVFSTLNLLLPLGIILTGVLMLRRRSATAKSAASRRVRMIAYVVGLCVFTAGTIGAFYGGIVPLYELYRAQSWVSDECTVLSSSLKTSSASASGGQGNSSSKGYFIRIIYSYAVAQRNYVSDRFNFEIFGSGDDDALAQVTSRYPTEAKVQCWVDPQNPYEAVLEREFSFKYILGFWPLLASFGGLGLLAGARKII